MISQALAVFLLSLGGVIFVDLILSGDNALVIGSAIVSIPRRWRRTALIFGGAAAILLRILCTIFATFLLSVNYLQLLGGLFILYVTRQVLVEAEPKEQSEIPATHNVDKENKTRSVFFTRVLRPFSRLGQLIASVRQPGQERFLMAILTIVITDISMSLDNIIAIAALARGQLIVLSIGLVVSIVILLVGSALIALLLERMPYLISVSGLVLAWVSGDLILQDTSKWLPFVHQYMPYSGIAIYILTFSFVLLAILERWKRARRPPSTSVKDVDMGNTLSNKQ